jgi:peptidoglycan/xylan/chitin deacetylase (PgdA/CDA1 family)
MQKGIFTISLDFELFWGVRDHRTLENYGENIRNVHIVVPRLLKLFEKAGVHCTWATVGFLFFRNKEELLKSLPTSLPDYYRKEYDPYSYIQQNGLQGVYHFAPELVEMIKKTPGQEIGTHTFSHFYTLERNTTAEQFRDDIKAAKTAAANAGIDITSIVFPRNQYSAAHVDICRQLGISVYRGNEESGMYKPVSRENENIFRRAVRFVDGFINLTGHHCHSLPPAGYIVNVPASRFLRPYSPKLKAIGGFKFRRIKRSMEYAAAHGLIYHLWWHPHNFGRYMEENFLFLERILNVYRQLELKQKMESLNMKEIYNRTRNIPDENQDYYSCEGL